MSEEQDKHSQAIDSGMRTIRREADALMQLSETVGAEFGAAVASLSKVRENQGRIVVTGMGKSGHIARKIAATMASTGAPAFFVHPGEASHGDLGMITRKDAVIALSNSGEAPELSDIMAYTRRFSIPLIAITSKKQSTLAVHADHILLMPPVPEACPNGLAPTSSTTMSIALGDALAIALLNEAGLTADQFRLFHPGGKLGKKLLMVGDIMTRYDDLPLVDQDVTMDQAILVMTEKNLGSVVAVDEKKHLIGIITDGDLKRHMGSGLLQKKVSEIMISGPKTIEPDALAVEALDAMLDKNGQRVITSLYVENSDGTLAGLIRVQDCLQHGVV